MKVLIVDDEILVRKGLALGVDWQHLGFDQVFEANNGVDALEITKKERPELIFTDIKMPKMDGIELIDKVKSQFPETVILVLSCMNDSENIREALKFNRALDFITKLTMTTEELTRIVIKAKTYIKNGIEVSTSSYKTVLSHEDFKELRNAIDDYNQSSVKEIIGHIFEKAIATEVKMSEFVEWIQLLGLFGNKLKEVDLDITQIIIGDINAYDYLNNAINIEILKQRFTYFVEEYYNFVKMNKGIYVGVEIKQIVKRVREDYQSSFKLGDIAKEIGLNESYLSRLFKKQMGMNFSDYLNQVRLGHAKVMLMEQTYPIYEIATLVGYNSESYFSRIFKQYEGVSPKQFVLEHKNVQ